MTRSLRGAAAIVGAVDATSPSGTLDRTVDQLELDMVRDALDDDGAEDRTEEKHAESALPAQKSADAAHQFHIAEAHSFHPAKQEIHCAKPPDRSAADQRGQRRADFAYRHAERRRAMGFCIFNSAAIAGALNGQFMGIQDAFVLVLPPPPLRPSSMVSAELKPCSTTSVEYLS